MLKKYKAKSCISLSIQLATGGSTHVSFTPLTGGGSVFYTDNEKIQSGLENHPKFGKLFRSEELPVSSPSEDTPNEIVDDETKNVNGSALRKVKVLCNDDAKDYLADKFNVSRSKLRSRSQIEDFGKKNGIEFVWESTKKTDTTTESPVDDENENNETDENSELNDDEV